MIQIAPTHAQLLRHQLELPDALRQNHVLIKFAEPVSAGAIGDFVLVRLSPTMQNGGEDQPYLPHIFQPHRTGSQRCRIARPGLYGNPVPCDSLMERTGIYTWRCTNPKCRLPDGRPTHLVDQVRGPLQGVIKVLYFTEWVVRSEPRRYGTVEYTNRALLRLDRRYGERTLCGIVRTCHELAAQRGWRILN
jgi:hypothetical protein